MLTLLMNFMNCMKKLLSIKIIIVSLLMVFAITTIVLALVNRKKVNYYMTYPKEYYLMNDNKSFSVNLYSTQKNDDYLEKENVERVLLTDKNSENFYEVKLENIVENNEIVSYDNKKFSKYRVDLKIPIETKDNMQINDASITIYYTSSENIKLSIGSIIFNPQKGESDIKVTHLKGIVNEIESKMILMGVGMYINNTTKQDIKILSINTLDERINVKNQICLLNNQDYTNEIKIKELENSNIVSSKLNFPIIIKKEEQQKLLLLLEYDKPITIQTLGFIIEYEIMGKNYHQFINPFQYFNTTSKKAEIVRYECY